MKKLITENNIKDTVNMSDVKAASKDSVSAEQARKKWWEIILFPSFRVTFPIVIIATIWLIYSFVGENVNPVLVYGSYLFSFYALTIVNIKLPNIIKFIKNKLYSNRYSGRFLIEDEFRATVTLYAGSVLNIIYALFYLVSGIFMKSLWMGGIAVYYNLLSLIRISLIRRDRLRLRITDEVEQRKYELKSGFLCGCLLFVLNMAISGLSVQMIWENKYYSYPGFIIYAQAAYTFIILTAAIVNIIKFRKMKRPILSAGKVVTMACALTSIQALQTAMLMEFGEGQMEFIQLMNTLTGVGVSLSVISMAIWLIYRTRKEIKIIDGGTYNDK